MRSGIVVALLAAGLASTAKAADESAWKPVDGTLKTRWAAKVDPKSPHPEYPRPQLVREKWTNLNGLWEYAIRPKDEGQPAKFDGEILVPYPVESALSGVRKPVSPEERLWYRRTVKVARPVDGSRLLLHFGAVDWDATVYVNGEEVGRHKGGFDPFTFDVTDSLKDSDSQEIVVSVQDPTDEGSQPRGKQVLKPHGIYYTANTGIWQTVWLEPVPERRVESLKIVPDIDAGEVRVSAKLSVNDPDATVRVKVSDGDKTIGEAVGRPNSVIAIKIDEPKLWSPDDPFLYDLKVDVEGDEVGSYFGMRKIAMGKDEAGVNRLLLNGKALFQYGPLDQGWWPDGLLTAPTDEALKFDVEETKRLGFNMIRKHVKVEPARWYYHCDKIGVLVWQDMPSANNKTDESRKQFELEYQRMIDFLHNHPSIVMWVPFNEAWGQYDTERIVGWTKKYDPTRLVNNTSGWTDKFVGDVNDMHNYPGPGTPPLEPERAAVLGEFGGLGLPLKGHLEFEKDNWGYRTYADKAELTKAYLDLVARLRVLSATGLCAGVYTQTTDVEIEVNGLLTYDREVLKLPAEEIAKAHAGLYNPGKVRILSATAQTSPQSWRYSTKAPADGWEKPDFDDKAWPVGLGGFGIAKTPGSIVNTEWAGKEIYLRREFELDEAPTGDLWLSIHHDDEAEVYINGQRVAEFDKWTKNYMLWPLDEKAAKALKTGRNVIAVHCRQDAGNQFIDVGVIEHQP